LKVINAAGKTDAALSWQTMFAVSGTPTLEYLVFPLDFNLETNLVDGSALAQKFSDTQWQVSP
jgi:hypothetical protein